MADDYKDIINMEHPTSKKHKRMSLYARAAQFAPFAALTGHDDAVIEMARLTDERHELDEDTLAKLNKKLNIISENISTDTEVIITYFLPDEYKDGGSYPTVKGIVKRIDEYENVVILTDGSKIPVNQIYGLESGLFKGLDSQ